MPGFFTAYRSGSKLRIVNTGMAVGARIMSSRTEASSAHRASDPLTSFRFCLSDLGRHQEAIVRDGNSRKNGAVARQERNEAVALLLFQNLLDVCGASGP